VATSPVAKEVPMRWSQLVAAQPRLAELGRERLVDPGIVLVVTTRGDGTPRLSPVEPLLWEDDLWLSMLLGSRKANDLLRDPRVLVHGIVTSRNGSLGEYKVRGEAVVEPSRTIHENYAEQVRSRIGWDPVPGQFHLFRMDIRDVSFIRYEDASGDQFVARWPANSEFVRRATSPTSLGDPEPHHELLAHGLS
jgi:hypothetical protein